MGKVPHRISRVIGLIALGIGLIVSGFVAYGLILADQNNVKAEGPTDFSAIPAKVQIEAPTLTLTDIHGTQHSLSDYRGQVVLVNLWATWCPPCQAEMPNLQDDFNNHQNEGFTVIAIEVGDPTSDVISFRAEAWFEFPDMARSEISGGSRCFQDDEPAQFLCHGP